jgi:hypothetical protein
MRETSPKDIIQPALLIAKLASDDSVTTHTITSRQPNEVETSLPYHIATLRLDLVRDRFISTGYLHDAR